MNQPRSATPTLLPMSAQSATPPAARNGHSATTRRAVLFPACCAPFPSPSLPFPSLRPSRSPLLSPPSLNLLHPSLLAQRRSGPMPARFRVPPLPSHPVLLFHCHCCPTGSPHPQGCLNVPRVVPDVISVRRLATARRPQLPMLAKPRRLGNLPAAPAVGRMVRHRPALRTPSFHFAASPSLWGAKPPAELRGITKASTARGAEIGAMEPLRDPSALIPDGRYFRPLTKSETDEADLDQSCNLPSDSSRWKISGTLTPKPRSTHGCDISLSTMTCQVKFPET
jgi:hypothetical protein